MRSWASFSPPRKIAYPPRRRLVVQPPALHPAARLAARPELYHMLDILFPGRPARTCDGTTRRDFLRVGSLGLAGLSLPALLRAEARAGAGGARKAGGGRAKSVVLVFLGGGLSHHDTFDPKPDAPDDIRGKYAPIGTAVPGLTVGEKL